MALPEITEPAGTVPFVTPHGATPKGVYANVGVISGAARKRRVYTTAPRVQHVTRVLSPAQMVAYDDWFENVLLVGTRKFAVRVANPDGGFLWWEAQWVAPYNAEPVAGNLYWILTGDLLLTGEGSETGPVSTSATLEIVAALTSTATATFDGHAALEVEAALLTLSLSGSLEMVAALLPFVPEFLIREDGGYILREDGGRIQRE